MVFFIPHKYFLTIRLFNHYDTYIWYVIFQWFSYSSRLKSWKELLLKTDSGFSFGSVLLIDCRKVSWKPDGGGGAWVRSSSLHYLSNDNSPLNMFPNRTWMHREEILSLKISSLDTVRAILVNWFIFTVHHLTKLIFENMSICEDCNRLNVSVSGRVLPRNQYN